MAEDKCACQGIRLYTEMVKATYDGIYNPAPDLKEKKGEIAQKLYDHIFLHLTKPENKELFDLAKGKLEQMRKQLADESEHGLRMDDMRDAIHKSPALQQALVCGSPYKNEDDRLEAAKTIGQLATWMGDDDKMGDVLPALMKLEKQFSCKPPKNIYD